MLRKIISGGQTGVDRAALDAAIKMDIAHGGWIPRGRLTEDGPLPAGYALKETAGSDYAERTARNVEDADATLIISRGALTGGSALTLRLARESKRPCLHIDLRQQAAFHAALDISQWLADEKIEILNVAGPRASKDPHIYTEARKLLETLLYLELVHSGPAAAAADFSPAAETGHKTAKIPTSVAEAGGLLISEMALKDRVTLANMAEIELESLDPTLGKYVLTRFELDGGNTELLEACRWTSGSLSLPPPAAARVIVRAAWKKLQNTHKLRVLRNPTSK